MQMSSALRAFGTSVRRGCGLIAAISLVSNILLLALPLYSLQIFDRVLLSRSLDTLWILTFGVLIALSTVALIDALRGQLLLRLSNRLALTFERRLFDEILQRASRFGDRSLQPVRDLSILRSFIVSPQGLLTLIDAPLVPFFLVIVFLMHIWLGIAMAAGMAILLLTAYASDRYSISLSKTVVEATQQAQVRLEEFVRASDSIVAHGIQEEAYQHWRKIQHPVLGMTSVLSTRTGEFGAIAKGCRLLVNVMLTGVGAYLAINDQITSGTMIAASILSSRGLSPLESLIAASRQLMGAQLAYKRLDEALASPTPPARIRLPEPRGEIEVQKVIYIPPSSTDPIIKGISFQLKPGTFLGLIGPSGSGKTTLGKLLCGVWPPKSGAIRLDGAELSTWRDGDRGGFCGYLPQDVQLIDGTVRENICRFSIASDEEIIEAARAAGTHDLILRLPKGYETQVGLGGGALSAGQRQRIGLARALFRNPRFVVLDEPNANLDSEGEQALNDCLALAKSRGTTMVVISHRPSILDLSDQLAVLVDGQLQQFGAKHEIMKIVQPRPLKVSADVV